MDIAYRPKDPRGKLREIVKKHLGVLRMLRLTPNCDVVFVATAGSEGPNLRGWLLKDPQGECARRYLLLDDGDVWREVEMPDPQGEGTEQLWMQGPDDDLCMLLSRSGANARLGGPGFLEDEAAVLIDPHPVADRREADRPQEGPDRRRPRQS